MKINADFHVHTIYSDGCINLEELILRAKKKGFKIITKADHNTTKGNKQLKRLAETHNMIFIPSVEISTKEGHILGINIENWERRNGGKTMQDQIDFVLDEGGIPVICHPYWRGGLGKKIFELENALGYEIMNHSSPFGSLKLLKGAKKEPKLYNKFGKYSGSDSHGGIVYGEYFTTIKCDSLTKESIIEAMFKKMVEPHGPLLNLALWLRDGWKNQTYQLIREMLKKI